MPLITPENGIILMNHRPLLPGRAYRFLYPAINFDCLRPFCPLIERRVVVSRVRDMAVEQLDPETLTSRPYTSRGRWLATGLDLEKCEERSFYVHAMVEVVEIVEPKLTGFDVPCPSLFARSADCLSEERLSAVAGHGECRRER